MPSEVLEDEEDCGGRRVTDGAHHASRGGHLRIVQAKAASRGIDDRVAAGVKRIRARGMKAAHAHLRYLNPFPSNLGEVLRRYDKVLVPEINLGQLALLLRGRYLVDVISYNRVRGLPFQSAEPAGVIEDVIGHA